MEHRPCRLVILSLEQNLGTQIYMSRLALWYNLPLLARRVRTDKCVPPYQPPTTRHPFSTTSMILLAPYAGTVYANTETYSFGEFG